MMRLLKGIWRVLSGISRVITVLVPLVFVAIFAVAVVLVWVNRHPNRSLKKPAF